MTNLDRQEEKRLRNRRETRVLAQRTDILATTSKTQRQQLPSVKIGLERINTQRWVTVEVLLDNRATELVMSSELARK